MLAQAWMRRSLVALLAVLLGVGLARIVTRAMAPVIPADEPFVIVRTGCDFAARARRCLETYEPSVLTLPLDTGSPELCRAARRELAGGWLLDDHSYCESLAMLTRARASSISKQLPTPLFVRGSRSVEGLSTEGFRLVGAEICSERWRELLTSTSEG